MADFQGLRDQLSKARGASESARQQLYAEKQTGQRLDAEIAALDRSFDPHNAAQVAERKRDLIQANYVYKADVDALRRLMGADLTPEMRAKVGPLLEKAK